MAKLCEVCSKLDVQHLTRPLYPCRKPLPCSEPPLGQHHEDFISLGSIDKIKSRRFACDICKLIAESLDKEPPELSGECRIRESAEFCNFKLPGYVKARDRRITHFHFTQTSVIFDTSVASQFTGPSLPWDLKKRDNESNHYILNLQIQARSCARAGEFTLPSSQTENEFLDTIGGRLVTTEVNPQLIRAWLHQCESRHGTGCTSSLRLPASRAKESSHQPTFVIDVIQSCIADTPSRCRYIALSYVWGTAPVFKHLLENTRDLRKAGSLRSVPIPATIRDAMTLVHAIGERYLWVDSLCIIQDDLKMQQTEIMRMGSIYSRALFTIIAAAGQNADSGLPGVRRESREQVQKLLSLANQELLTVIDIRKTPSGIDETLWAHRAWTFQERVLSGRVLVFSENQVYWSCRAATYSEERALEDVRDIDQLNLSFPQTFATAYLSREPLQALEYCSTYYELLSGYRQRRLTYQTDLLNAFNGVSEILAALQNDAFLWGLPESLFSYAMTWSFTGHSAKNHVNVPVFNDNGSKDMISIPSWSWAAWSGENPDSLPFLHPGNGNDVRPVIQFYIVDKNHQLVKVKERSWPRGDRVPTSWKNKQPPPLPTLPQGSTPRIGQLHFWTSFANLRVIRGWRVQGPGEMQYTLFPSPDFLPDPNSTHYRTEFIQQGFIVVAANGPKRLMLLAIEWKDGVAYRVGKADVKEDDWVRIQNRQWRSIILE